VQRARCSTVPILIECIMSSPTLAILIIHGMGKMEEDFAQPLIDGIRKRIGEERWKQVAIEPCWWDPVTKGMQEFVFSRLEQKYKVCYKDLHHFTIDALGDPVSYLSSYEHSEGEFSCYRRIHDTVLETLRKLQRRVGEDAPLMIIAHSLGSVIVTNYRWDVERNTPTPHYHPRTTEAPRTPMERMDTMVSLITYGSNIPLFISVDPTKGETVESIKFPPEGVDHTIANWDNIFSPSDILGWPLNNLWSEGYGPGKPINDMMMPVGPIWRPLRRWTPLTHLYYSTDRKFLRHIQKRIEEVLLRLEDESEGGD